MPAARAKDDPLAQAVLLSDVMSVAAQRLPGRRCAALRIWLDNLVQGVFNNALGPCQTQAGDQVAHHVDLHH